MNYYNDSCLYCCQWLDNLIREKLIPYGVVDPRPIEQVEPNDVMGFTGVHFFAGLGGWPYALRLAGWPDDRPVWTGSCPCQPFSQAGKRKGTSDSRHLWPHFYRIIRGARPRPVVILGKQVSGAAGYGWLDGVGSDLETEGYSWGAADIPACGIGAPHIRNRIYWVAVSESEPGRVSVRQRGSREGAAHSGGGSEVGRSAIAYAGSPGFWDDFTIVGPDPKGKYRRVGLRFRKLVVGLSPGLAGVRPNGDAQAEEGEKEMIPLLSHGTTSRVAKLRALGNSICPQLAAEVIKAFLDTEASK